MKKMMEMKRSGVVDIRGLEEEVKYSIKKQYDFTSDKVIYYNKRAGSLMLFNMPELLQQLQAWRDVVVVQDYNIYEKQIQGRTWYMFIVQPKGNELENVGLCPLAMAFGVMVSGYAYMTHDKNVLELVKRVLVPKQ